MVGEYRLAKGWQVFIYVFAPILIIGFAALGALPFTADEFNWVTVLILVPISIGMMVMGVYGLLETIYGKVTITETSITQKKISKTKTILFDNVKGIRENEQYLVIFSTHGNPKSVQISKYHKQYQELVNWFRLNFADLDVNEAFEEEGAVLENEEFGITVQAREAKFAEAKKVSTAINILGGAAIVWVWFFPQPYSYSVLFSMAIPVLGLAAAVMYKGLIKLDEKKNSKLPTVIYGVFLPISGLGIRALLDYNVILDGNTWSTSASAAVALVLVIRLSTDELKFKKPLEIFLSSFIAVVMFAYSISVYIIVNCLFDNSHPSSFTTKVIDKEISSGKSTSYYLVVEPWGPMIEKDKFTVSEQEYNSYSIGENVVMYLQDGLLETKWYYVGKQ